MITKLHLMNFKCFGEIDLELKPLNLLTGINGMGKSSVIQSLLLLRQSHEYGLFIRPDKRLSLNGEYVTLGTSNDVLYTYAPKPGKIEIGIEFNNGEKIQTSWNHESKSDSLAGNIKSSNSVLKDQALFTNSFHYLSAERIGPRPFYTTSSTKVVHQNQLGVQGEFATNYFSFNRYNKINSLLAYKNYLGPSDSPLTDGLSLGEQMNKWLSVIKPGTRILVEESNSIGINSLEFEFLLGKDNPGSYRSINVGFGLTYSFPLILAILSSSPGSLLLLENPEAHLHPQGQAELGILLSLAAASGIQLIVETHSDHILNGIRFAVKNGLIKNDEAKLLFFNGSVVNDRFQHIIDEVTISPGGKLSHRPDNFFDVWDKMLIKLI